MQIKISEITKTSSQSEKSEQSPQQNPIFRPRPRKGAACLTNQLKIIIIIIVTLSYALYRLSYNQSSRECIYDRMHQWTNLMNRKLHHNDYFYQIMLTLCQESIEANILLLFILNIWKMKNLRAPYFMILFYGVRTIFIEIERFPYPLQVKWDPPNISSLTVPYGITRDFYFSGHTGLMLFCTHLWMQLGFDKLYWCCCMLTPVVILILLATRVHYTIDIVGAAIFTLWIKAYLLKHVAIFDKLMSCLLKITAGVLLLMRKIYV